MHDLVRQDTLTTPTGSVDVLSRTAFERLAFIADRQGLHFDDGRDGLFRNTDPGRIPLIDADNDWDAMRCFLEDKALSCSPNTLRSYEKECIRLLLWCRFFARKPFSSLNREDARNYQLFMQNPTPEFVVQPKDGQAYTPGPMLLADGQVNPNWRPFRVKRMKDSSVRTGMAALKSLSKFLINADYLTASPFTLGRLTPRDVNTKQNIRKKVLRETAKRAIDEVIENLPDATPAQRRRMLRKRYIFDLFYFLGLRVDEGLNAQMSAFHIVNGNTWFRALGKGGKERTIPVPNELLRSLADYRLVFDFDESFPLPTDTHPLIGRLDPREAIEYTQLRRILQELFRLGADQLEQALDGNLDPEAVESVAVLRAATPHWLRHTYATDLFEVGVDPRHIQENLGHQSMDTTLIYNENVDTARHEDTQKRQLPREF